MTRTGFVLCAALFSVAGIVAGYFATRGAVEPRAPRSRATPPVASPGAQPAAAPDRPTAAADPAPAPLPDRKPAGASQVEAASNESVEALFERAMGRANVQRDFKGAIALFKQVVARQAESRLFAARALYEIGCCLEQMGRGREAVEAFRMVVELYADQREPAEAARRKLPKDEQDALSYDEEVRKRIAEGRIDLDLVATPLSDVVALVREQTRLNIIVDESGEGEGLDRPVTVRLWNATIAEALDRIVPQVDAEWLVRNGCILIRARTREPRAAQEEPPTLPAWEADIPAWKQEEEEMRTTLAATPVSMSLDDASLVEMTRAFQEAATKLIVIDDAVQDAGNKKVTFRVQDLDPSQSLDLICMMLDLEWYVDRGTIHVTTKEAAESWRKGHE